MMKFLEPMEHSFLLPFEENFPSYSWWKWMQDHWSDTLHIGIVYMIAIFLGQYLMKNRKPFSLQKLLIIWNMMLALISAIIFFRLSTDVIDSITRYGLYESVCVLRDIEDRSVSMWIVIFTLSKVTELFDTAFIVLRKRKLIFLHWYHHVTVMIYTFYSTQNLISTGRWFISANSFIHMLMYTYYCLNAMKIRPPKAVSMILTLLQTSQMLVGCYVNYLVYTFQSAGLYCAVPLGNFLASVCMYFSFFLLFVKYFYDSYVQNATKDKNKLT